MEPMYRMPVHHSNGDNFKRKNFYLSLFSGFDVIVELGVSTGETSKTFIECLPKKVIGVDITGERLNLEEMYLHAEKYGVEYQFILADDLTIDPPSCDVLFIDTTHTEEHTYQELKKYSPHTRHYIALHDIVPVFETLKGYDRWKSEFGEDWEEFYRDNEVCGLLVIKRKK